MGEFFAMISCFHDNSRKTMEQKCLLSSLILASLFISTSCSQPKKALRFETGNFTEETRTVQTSSGEKEVTYKAYLHIPYVSNPVDTDYQSLNIYVPISINGSPIDPSSAPILFDIAVGGFMSVNNAKVKEPSYRGDLALAAGYVVVAPGCRGWDNCSADGTYYGKAPAAIVDLKSAIRYLRHNERELPGNTEHIISVGCSAGGALSALLGASANNSLFTPYLEEIGAADASDHVFATACYSPITDLEHADMAYEWMFGSTPTSSGLVDQELSEQLKSDFSKYQLSLNLQGKDGFGLLTAENYRDYLTTYYLVPSLTKFLNESPNIQREEYLKRNAWITWENGSPNFKFDDYVTHVGRLKGLPAFDDFGKGQPEPLLFGNEITNARHFTDFSLRHTSKNIDANVEEEVRKLVNMMNAFYFLKNNEGEIAQHWWLRNGTSDNHTSQTVMINLAAKLENMNKNVDTWIFWDGDHCADNDPEGFITWIETITRD
jgi:hypothetical protein